jgi:hypothetical protein
MLRSRWMRNLFGVARSREDRRRLAARNRKPIRLLLESLEDRLTPSAGNPTVLQMAGSYPALNAAIALDTAPNTNYVIQITNSFQFNSGGQVAISKLANGSTLTIEGQNGANYTLTGNGNRLFTVASGQNVTFADLTLTGGSVTGSKGNAQGGAILDHGGNVTLSQMVVEGNTVKDSTAQGGGVFASGAGTLVIRDSTLSNNSAQGIQGTNATDPKKAGGLGGSAYGGGLYVAGSGWTVTLTGDTLSGNTAMGGKGGNGAAGSNATAANSSGGNGGEAGTGGWAEGGAAYFSVSAGTGNLSILNDQSAPTTNPSIMIANSAQGGSGGNGGAGGTSTGTALDSAGGLGGGGREALGGALYVYDGNGATLNANIGNTTFYANKAVGGNEGANGASGTGGQSHPTQPSSGSGGEAYGGGLALVVGSGSVTIVNSTVAQNTAQGGGSPAGGQGFASGAGIFDFDGYDGSAATVLENNTITQNIVDGGSRYIPPPPSGGAGTYLPSSSAGISVAGYSNASHTLFNNLIQGNRSANSSALDLDVTGTLSNASNNFIGTMSANAVSTSTNLVGSTQVQLGYAVGVDANGKPTGGPIYYPLLSGTASIGAGSSSVLGTIAGVEGTTSANATDEIGNPRSSNGSVDLGAVQTVSPISSYPLILTYNPASQTAYAGGPVSFTISASGTPMPTVQWQVSTNGGNTWNNITGATSPTLALDNVTVAMNGDEYQAVITNSSGSVTSDAVTLTVNSVPPSPPSSPPAPPAAPPPPPTLQTPPLLAFLDSLLGSMETVNSNGTETITDSVFGIPLIVATFDSEGNLMSVDLFGSLDITSLFV